MKRTFVMSMYLAAFALAATGEEPPAIPTSPVIVKYLKITKQTGAIPSTAIYTPTTDGIFRLSVVEAVSATNPANSGQGSFCSSVDAKDLSGQSQFYGGLGQCVPITGSFVNSAGYALYYFEVQANTPILYQTTLIGTPPVAPFAYDVAIVIEQLR